MRPLAIGVVGATGMVGQTFMRIIEERQFPIAELRPFASDNSLGKTISLQGKTYPIQVLKESCFDGLDLVFFSSGEDISLEWAPKAIKAGAYAVDNSSAFRMAKDIPLVVPEVNGHLLKKKSPQIIANPNCSTIQLVVALKPLADKFGLEEVRVSSYQAVSGAGQAAYDELLEQTTQFSAKPHPTSKNFPQPIAFNLIPQIGSFNEAGYCSEEIKIMNETRKILELPKLKVSAFTVRVPVLNAHSESVWVTLNKVANQTELVSALEQAPGLQLMNNSARGDYPTPKIASGQDPVFVGRIHQDLNDQKTWLMWIVADNIRKGAALNGIQIAEHLF